MKKLVLVFEDCSECPNCKQYSCKDEYDVWLCLGRHDVISVKATPEGIPSWCFLSDYQA